MRGSKHVKNPPPSFPPVDIIDDPTWRATKEKEREGKKKLTRLDDL